MITNDVVSFEQPGPGFLLVAGETKIILEFTGKKNCCKLTFFHGHFNVNHSMVNPFFIRS